MKSTIVVMNEVSSMDSGFTTINALVSNSDKLPEQTFILCSGYNLPTLHGLSLDIYGEVKNGRLCVRGFEVVKPWNTYLAIKYLNYMFGLDNKFCEEIILRFGLHAFNVIEDHPDYLMTLHGMTRDILDNFLEKYTGFNNLNHIITLFSPYGLTFNECNIINKEFGASAENVLKYNPYLLMKAGIPFDKIKKINNVSTGINEASAYILQIINDYTFFSGSSCVPYKEVKKKFAKKYSIDFSDAVAHAIKMYSITNVFGLLYKNDLFVAEKFIAQKISDLLKSGRSVNMDQFSSMTAGLNEEQKLAVNFSITNSIFIITGGPGTGKSTTMKAVCKISKALGENIILMAPTAAAAERLTESTGLQASTIHSAIGLVQENYLPTKSVCGRIIVDEASMVDTRLLNALLRALSKGSSIILVGDTEQLSPVNEGFTLADMLTISDIPRVVLRKGYRQKDNTLKDNFRKIAVGNIYLTYNDVFSIHCAGTMMAEKEIIVKEYIEALKQYDIKDICCVSPFRKKTEIATAILNESIRSIVNPAASSKHEVRKGNNILREGDRVLNNINFEDIANGMTGFIKEISNKKVIVCFDNGKTYSYKTNDAFERLDLGYAITVHKSQGLEFKHVIIGLADHRMVSRSMIYTAATRAKERVIFVGTKDMLSAAIKRKQNIVYGGISTLYNKLIKKDTVKGEMV